MKKAITLQYLTMLSKARKKTRQTDPSINGLVWRISETGTVSAAYRLGASETRKDTVKVFRANMQLNSTAFTEVRKKAMEMELKVISGESPFDEPASLKKDRYTIGEYHLVFTQDRPVDQYVKNRMVKKIENSIKRDKVVEKWMMNRVVGSKGTQPILLSDVYLDDPAIPRMLDRVLNEVINTGKGKENYRKGLAMLKRMYKNARRNKVIDDDPLEDLESFTFRSTRARDIPPAELLLILKECRRLAAGEGVYAGKKWMRLGLMFEIKALLGCRLKELNTVRKEQINFHTNTITLSAIDTKTRKPYRFAFPDEVGDLIKRSPAWNEPHNDLVFGIDNKFCTSCDKEWHEMLDHIGLWGNTTEIEIEKKRILRNRSMSELSHAELSYYENCAQRLSELKLSRARGHDTRHAFATDEMRSAIDHGLVVSDRDIREVAKGAGKGLQHSSVEMTMHYTHMDDDMKRGLVANRINSLKQISGSTE